MTKQALVADDCRSLRMMIADILTRSGFEVTAAENGQMALEVAKQRSFDIVLTDLNMPVMDGLRLTKRLRELPTFKTTPILIVTTESQLQKKDEGRQAGATGWVVKPIVPDQLLAVLRKLLLNAPPTNLARLAPRVGRI